MSHCRKCGRCCWDFKGNDPGNRCEHLDQDLVTCLVYDNPGAAGACGGLGDGWPERRHTCDLPEDCGYVLYWRKQGMI